MQLKEYRWINKNDLSNYEKDNKRLSYRNLFYKDENLMLCNNIAEDWESLEQLSGFDDDNDDYITEIYQYYLIDESTAERLQSIGEIVFYHNKLDLYVLGVTHFGTSWDYVLTSIKLEPVEGDENWFSAVYESEVD